MDRQDAKDLILTPLDGETPTWVPGATHFSSTFAERPVPTSAFLAPWRLVSSALGVEEGA
jgi:hypothetical protein